MNEEQAQEIAYRMAVVEGTTIALAQALKILIAADPKREQLQALARNAQLRLQAIHLNHPAPEATLEQVGTFFAQLFDIPPLPRS